MAFMGQEKRSVTDISTGRLTEKTYLKFRCPKPGCPNPVDAFLDKSGYKNPYVHLKSCYAKVLSAAGQEATVRS